jgi:hypothetical protein
MKHHSYHRGSVVLTTARRTDSWEPISEPGHTSASARDRARDLLHGGHNCRYLGLSLRPLTRWTTLPAPGVPETSCMVETTAGTWERARDLLHGGLHWWCQGLNLRPHTWCTYVSTWDWAWYLLHGGLHWWCLGLSLRPPTWWTALVVPGIEPETSYMVDCTGGAWDWARYLLLGGLHWWCPGLSQRPPTWWT